MKGRSEYAVQVAGEIGNTSLGERTSGAIKRIVSHAPPSVRLAALTSWWPLSYGVLGLRQSNALGSHADASKVAAMRWNDTGLNGTDQTEKPESTSNMEPYGTERNEARQSC
jgi:hypothetical protein